VDPVPDPLLLRKSGSAGNRTRDLWVSSQELTTRLHRRSYWCYLSPINSLLSNSGTNTFSIKQCLMLKSGEVRILLKDRIGHAVAQPVIRRLSTPVARIRAWMKSLGSVVETTALGQVFSEYFCFPCYSFIPLSVPQNHHLSSRAGTRGQ
jgi:hypothetical protein